MSGVRSLRIRLGKTNVGHLFAMDDGRTYFRFDDAYALDLNRPILSQAFQGDTEAETLVQLMTPVTELTVGPGGGVLPVFFSNLLPEGVLRKQLIQDGKLNPTDEFALLATCGEDLPGDVWAVHDELDAPTLGRLVTQGMESYELSSYQTPAPTAISLSGVQPKIALVSAPGGRYVMRSKNNQGRHFIGKLPATDSAGMPEVEFTSLQLAAAAGVTVCVAELLPMTAIADQIPFSLRDDGRNFLLVHRFDRDVDTPTRRLHMEDFAQALEIMPANKYAGSYAAIGLALIDGSSAPDDDLIELVRRIKVNELLGNFDAHTKNFSLLYRADGAVRLSPAYDIVAHAAYQKGAGHGLVFFPGQPEKTTLTPDIVRRLSNQWDVPEAKLKDAVIDAVDRAMRLWLEIIETSLMSGQQKEMLKGHIAVNASAQSWTRKQVRRPRI
ncbi:serine/threonine-protein kinase HipA [Actimicrobium sp. GrIS 1.19]|uniref:type II toxin-antitoxin system HipA family toxin n=1 Tax=Actimicrobium sp. GrIS 1.19 TaxID=3071708 RepID=UPI002E0CDCBC|nr:serine/threonine-protein kinase HipA [Actimicrobium sp. GrIS 1.19]